MKIWILGLIALVLLLIGFTVREHIDPEGGVSAPSQTVSMPPKCPPSFTLEEGRRCTKFVEMECPEGFPVDAGTGKCFKTQDKTGDFSGKKCPEGTQESGEKCFKLGPEPLCPNGYTIQTTTVWTGGMPTSVGKCVSANQASSSVGAPAIGSSAPASFDGGPTIGAPPVGSGGRAAVTGGTSTGGTSTSSYGPNSGAFGGMGDRRKQVFGPIAMGRGEGDEVVPVDSSKTNQYPELLGGGDNKPSTRIEGAGIVPPSKNWQLSQDGSLPSSKSLGSDEMSKYFPFSRQPGDMELIPDPYRVSQQFSAASYSFKTEPVPFLTDFSAFQK